MDLWKADGLKSQQPGDMTALPTSDTSTNSFSTLSWVLWIERSPSKADSKLYLILRSKWCKSRNLLGCILRVYRDCNCYKVTAVFLILANFVLALLSWFACRAQVSNTNNCVSYRKKPKQTASFPVNKLYSEKYFLQNSTMVFSSLLENFVTPKNSYQILSFCFFCFIKDYWNISPLEWALQMNVSTVIFMLNELMYWFTPPICGHGWVWLPLRSS